MTTVSTSPLYPPNLRPHVAPSSLTEHDANLAAIYDAYQNSMTTLFDVLDQGIEIMDDLWDGTKEIGEGTKLSDFIRPTADAFTKRRWTGRPWVNATSTSSRGWGLSNSPAGKCPWERSGSARNANDGPCIYSLITYYTENEKPVLWGDQDTSTKRLMLIHFGLYLWRITQKAETDTPRPNILDFSMEDEANRYMEPIDWTMAGARASDWYELFLLLEIAVTLSLSTGLISAKKHFGMQNVGIRPFPEVTLRELYWDTAISYGEFARDNLSSKILRGAPVIVGNSARTTVGRLVDGRGKTYYVDDQTSAPAMSLSLGVAMGELALGGADLDMGGYDDVRDSISSRWYYESGLEANKGLMVALRTEPVIDKVLQSYVWRPMQLMAQRKTKYSLAEKTNKTNKAFLIVLLPMKYWTEGYKRAKAIDDAIVEHNKKVIAEFEPIESWMAKGGRDSAMKWARILEFVKSAQDLVSTPQSDRGVYRPALAMLHDLLEHDAALRANYVDRAMGIGKIRYDWKESDEKNIDDAPEGWDTYSSIESAIEASIKDGNASKASSLLKTWTPFTV